VIRAARLSLKLHHSEISLALAAAVGLGVWAVVLIARLAAVNVPATCLDAWVAAPGEYGPGCAGPLRAWGNVLADGSLLVDAMSIAPFAIGLLGGIPIVSRELEGRTAQTAWSLEPSRLRWLAGRLLPIAALLGAALVFAGLMVGIVEEGREIWGEPALFHIGHHGLRVVPRACAALGVGLLLGALVGRSLPAFVMGVVLCYGLAQGSDLARQAWLATLPARVIAETARSIQTGWAWQEPGGGSIDESTALALVPEEIAARDRGLPQAINALRWLEDRGYVSVPTGVSMQDALGWADYDSLIFVAAGLGAFVAAGAVICRRRPP
jgi:hypothetical protein